MIPVMQTKFATPDQGIRGNCLAACVASLLEVPLESVPAFEDAGDAWFDELWAFLHANGYTCEGSFYPPQFGDTWWNALRKRCSGVDGYYIVGGISPRAWVRSGHAVIYKGGHMVHDPHPSRAGIVLVENVFMIERGQE